MFAKFRFWSVLVVLLPALALAVNDESGHDKGAATESGPPFWLRSGEPIRLIPQAATPNITGLSGVEPQQQFTRFPDIAPPVVPDRRKHLSFFPCSQCHEHLEVNESPRVLAPVHEVALKHGDGRLWCLNCHDAEHRDQLRTIRGDAVDFSESWKVCGQCHSRRLKDWYYGAHGKRIYFWNGEKVAYNCTHCHNPHQPPFMHRKPQKIPPVRAGLEPMKHDPDKKHRKPKIWEKHKDRLVKKNPNATEDKADGADNHKEKQ